MVAVQVLSQSSGTAVEEVALQPASAREFWIFPIPPRARWNPSSPPKFGIALKIIFIFTAMLSELTCPCTGHQIPRTVHLS